MASACFETVRSTAGPNAVEVLYSCPLDTSTHHIVEKEKAGLQFSDSKIVNLHRKAVPLTCWSVTTKFVVTSASAIVSDTFIYERVLAATLCERKRGDG